MTASDSTERRFRPLDYALLSLYLVGFPLMLWSGWAVRDRGPQFDGARFFLMVAVMIWIVALNVNSLIGKRRRSASPVRAVSDDSDMLATAGPRLMALGGLLICAWFLPSAMSIAIAIGQSGEPWRILAATPMAAVVTIMLSQVVYRNLRRLVTAA